ncbi:MAG: methionyl-tRNA formyltransferase [Eggerthellaceae bacterium]|nr:methionyl-tRNA formyltransferase [Eggerthellaceae bacterium]
MRIVFMGTPGLAATILEALAAHHEVMGVFTRPDAVRGRGKKLVPSPVKQVAQEQGIEVHEMKSLRIDGARELVDSLAPDVICVAAYGAILPREILDIPRYGCLNVHTSLLPRWRGAAPIERAILAHDERTGVCIMKLEESLDTGPYCVRREAQVDGKYLDELAGELATCGAEALLEALEAVESGTARWTEQAEEGLTYAAKIGKGELDPTPEESAKTFVAKVRASNESHPSRITLAGRKVAVERAAAMRADMAPDNAQGLKPGQATFTAKRLFVAASDGIVELERVKPDGKKSMEGRAFAAGVQGIKNAQVTWGRA